MTPTLPPVLLLDLDDTLVHFTVGRPDFWAQSFAAVRRPGEPDAARFSRTVARVARPYWSDPERAARGRLDLQRARREIATRVFVELGLHDRGRAHHVADHFTEAKEAAVAPFEGAIETLEALQKLGVRLGLITNGHPTFQRRKLARYDLERHFEAVLIEGEWGMGKPHPSIFREALARMGADACEAWMVGDNLEADIAGAQEVGVYAVWIDHAGKGPPAHARPNRVVRLLRELLEEAEPSGLSVSHGTSLTSR